MRTIWKYVRPLTGRVAVTMLIKLIGTASELMLPWLLSYIIDDVVPQKSVGKIFLWGGAMVFFALLCVAGNVTANRKSAAVARDVTRCVRHDLYARIAYLSGAQVDAFSVPSLVSRLTTDTYNVHQMVGMVQRLGVRAPILLLGGIIITMFQDVPMALVLLATMPLIGISVTMVSVKGIPLFRKLQESLDELVRIVRENITGARVIKALSKGDYENDRFRRQSDLAARDNVRANAVMSLSSPFTTLFLNLGLVVVLIVGAYRVEWGLAKPGKIMAFLNYFTIVSNGMLGLSRIFVIVSRASASANRIEEVLTAPEDLAVLTAGDTPESPYHIEFRNVTFSYNKRKPTLSNISFRLKRGESLGLIGATGSGKSTILLLLMRFYDVDEGEIRIDGVNIKQIPAEKLHRMFGVTFQSDVVYADTARENIVLGREISEESVDRAVHSAQAAYLLELADGLNEHLNSQGTNLSGGQRQRLLIARALAGDPEILLLDDASSALDYRTDANLRAALRTGHGNATSIVVASRVSSIAHMTEIIVLDEGRAIAQGPHELLMKTSPDYRQIAETQMGGMN